MRQIWLWVGLLWTERVRAVLDHYGDRISDVSIFGWSVDVDGSLTQTFNPSLLDPYRAKWPHIRWWACFRNMEAPSGATSYQVFQGLRFDPSARVKLANDLRALMTAHPWVHGIDIDLEGGGDLYSAESEQVVQVVADTAHSRGKKVSAALPALTSTGSVGGENWVRYHELGKILDHVSIMSYDMAWNGSAPGPISPGFWMREVYSWATSQIAPHKVSMGLPAYSRAWHISSEPSGLYRGQSANYYGMRNYLDGTWSDAQGDSDQPYIAWLSYRDQDGQVPWALLGVYDWLLATSRSESSGVTFGQYSGRGYFTRYGKAVGTPMWSVADQSIKSEHATYTLRPRRVRDITGKWAGPRHGMNLTIELLRRRAESALILDDDARTVGQLTSLYTSTGNWSHWQQGIITGSRVDAGQYRVTGGGTLKFANNFGTQDLHLITRAQLPAHGRWGITLGKVRVDVSHTGQLRIMDSGTLKAETTLPLPGPSATPGQNQVVLGIRARGSHVRAYASTSMNSVPLRLEADVDLSSLDGTAGIWASDQVWVDYVRLGDGWWYEPREAIEVRCGDNRWLLGRDERTGVTWDHSRNLFRPHSDVEEAATLTLPTSLDWDFVHVLDFPAPMDKNTAFTIRPVDAGTWVGRSFLCDSEGAQIAYYADAHYLAHWLDQATHTYGVQGIAIWTLGQEDVRFWERISGGNSPSLNF